MDGLSTYLYMGGYAAFIWPAFGISAAVLVGLLWQSLNQLRRTEAELRRLQEDEVAESAGGGEKEGEPEGP